MTKDWTKDWFTARELLDMNVKVEKGYTLNKILPEKQILVNFGPEKSLKSSTAIELALAMTCPPQSWYGVDVTEPMKALYIFFEGEPGELKDKQQRAMTKYPNADLDSIIFKHFDDLPLDTDGGIAELNNLLNSLPLEPDVIFLDPFRGCLEGEENDARVHKKFLKNITPLGYRLIIVHHRSKPGKAFRTLGEMMRGSGVIGQVAHTLIGYMPNPQKEEQLTLKFKSRGPRPLDITIEIEEDGLIKVVTPTWSPYSKEEKAQVAIWNLLTQETEKLVTVEKTVGELEAEIADELGKGSERTIKKVWQKMVDLGIIRVRMEGKQKFLSISPLELEPAFPLW